MQKLPKQQISVHCVLACLYFLLLPTTIAINSAGNSILKLATIPIGAYFLLTIFLSNKKLQINGVHLALLLFTLSAVASLFCDNSSESMDFVMGYILNAALYICISAIPYNKAELELMENIQVLLLVILNLMTLFSNGTRFERTTLVIMGQTSDPNYFVGFFIFPLTIALKKIVSGKGLILHLALIAVSMYSIFFLGGGLVFLWILWKVFMPILPENIVERMSLEAVMETRGTGRMDIWMSMARQIVNQPENLLLGRGINAKHRLFLAGAWENTYAHNQILQITYNQGLIGLLSFLVVTGVGFFRCVQRRKTVAIAIVGMMALSISLSFNQTTRTFWNLIAYAAFAFPDSDTNTTNNGGLSDNECA